MKHYSKTKRIPLEYATKEEIITSIEAHVFPTNIRTVMESSIYWNRCHSVMAEMFRLCDVMTANLQVEGMPHDPEKRKQWQSASRKWEKANRKLNKLQGT
jgi:hypothetical protein